jgi:hypothetical protein
MSERTLISIRRDVPAADHTSYAAAWNRLHRAATALRVHAWRFRSVAGDDRHLEFLEFKTGPDPRDHPAVAAALDELDRLAPATVVEEWVGG